MASSASGADAPLAWISRLAMLAAGKFASTIDQLVAVAHRRQCVQQIGVQQRMDTFQHPINP